MSGPSRSPPTGVGRATSIVHWPNGFKAKGEIHAQFHHVIDVAPTILEAAGVPEPVSVNGVHSPSKASSMLYSFSDANAAEETQYFEMFGNRGIFHKGEDRSNEARDALGARGPEDRGPRRRRLGALRHQQGLEPIGRPVQEMQEKLRELQRLWCIEATRYNVLPIDDRVVEKINPDTAGRPVLIKGNTQLLFGHGAPVGELRPEHQEQVSLRHAMRAPRGSGANVGGWSLREERQAQVLL